MFTVPSASAIRDLETKPSGAMILRAALSMLIALLLSLFVGGIVCENIRSSLALERSTYYKRELVLSLQQTQILLLNAENAAEGYVIQGDPGDQMRYTSDAAALIKQQQMMSALTTANPNQRVLVTQLDQAIRERMVRLRLAMLSKNKRQDAARLLLDQSKTDATADPFAMSADADAGEILAWNRQSLIRARWSKQNLLLTIFLVLAEIGFLIWTFLLIHRNGMTVHEMARQHQELEMRHKEMTQQSRQLEVAASDLTILNARLEHASHRFQELYQALPVPCYCYNEAGMIIEWNRAFEECYALVSEAIFLQPLWQVAGTPEEEDLLRLRISSVFSGDIFQEWEQTWTKPNGSVSIFLCSAHPLRDQEGKIMGGINTAIDITARKHAEEATQRAEEKYRGIFENAIEGIFQSTPEGQFLDVNPAMARIFGFDSPEHLLQDTNEISMHCYADPKDRQRFISLITENGEVSDFETEMYSISKDRLWVSMNAKANYGADGKIVSYEGTLEDITTRIAAAKQLERSEQRLRAFHEITSDSRMEFSVQVSRLLELGCRELRREQGLIAKKNPSEFHVLYAYSPSRIIEPGYTYSSADAFHQGNPEGCLAIPLQVAGRDWGTLCFIDPRQRNSLTESEQDFLHLMVQWLTGELHRERSQAALQESERRFRSAIDAMQEGFIVQDEQGIVLMCNQAAENILQVPAQDLLMSPINRSGWVSIRDDGSEFPRDEQPSRVSLTTGRSQQGVILGLRRSPNMPILWLSLNSSPLYSSELYSSESDLPTAAVLTFSDITERRRQEALIKSNIAQIKDYSAVLEFQKNELEQQKLGLERANSSLEIANNALEMLATLDGLTGLKNYRTFQERLELELQRARRYHAPLSLVMIDVDYFKLYNDTYGHPAGDEVLKIFSRVLEEQGRETDLTARYGGEEFVLILPNTDGVGALHVAERVQHALKAQEWPLCPVTASFGISSLDPFMKDQAALIAAADHALYRAKEAGRDCVICAEHGISSAVNSS